MRYLLTGVLVVVAAACRADEPAASEAGIADLLKLPDLDAYKVDPYLNAAQSLQALGKDKACVLLNELAAKEFAAKDGWPFLRSITLCRMLFRAKPKGAFRRAAIGEWYFVADTESKDWPLEPITIVDGIPF
jgi:hypothetical protein